MRTSNLVATACTALALALGGAEAFSQPAPGAYILPDSLTPFIPGSTTLREGGLSSLFHAGRGEFWTITDRGPNVDSGGAKVFPVPGFQPTIYKIRLAANGTFSIINTIPLARPDGTPATGLPNPAPYNSGEVALDTNFNSVGLDDYGFDTEGILRAPDGTFWFCEEYAPGIAHVAADGRIIAHVRPQPAGGLPDILKRRVPNRGFEGIAMTPSGKIYAIVQSGMANSVANTAAANTNAGNATEMFRLVEYDPATGAARMFAYLMDAGYPASGGSNARRRDIKIGDMAAVNDEELLLIEHVQRGASNVKKVYKISLAGATPITAETFQTAPGVFKSLEELTRAELTSVAGITPVSKNLVIDLVNPGAGNTPWPANLDKPEGLAIISPTRIAVGNDNDFGVTADEAGHVLLTGARSNVIVYTLAAPLNFRQPVQITLDPTNNAPVCPSAGVTFRAAAIGSPTPTVQWQVSADGITYQNINGANADSLTLTGLTIGMNGNRYRALYSNALGSRATAPSMLSVVDDEAPSITVSVSPSSLWPPNNRMKGITATVTATDNCAGVAWRLSSIASNEGDVAGDIGNASIGAADNTFDLRAERDGAGDGRIYTITYTATDLAGNTSTATATVTVPHDNGGNKVVIGNGAIDESSDGFASSVAPTPFSGAATIGFTLGAAAETTVRIFNVRGELVTTLAAETMEAGAHTVRWNGSDARGNAMPAGTYFYAIESRGMMETGAMVLAR